MENFEPATYGDRAVDIYDELTPISSKDTDLHVSVLASLCASGTILEVGAGTGRIALPLAKMGIKVTALDASPRMIERLADRARDQAVAIDLRCDDIATMTPTGTYDVV